MRTGASQLAHSLRRAETEAEKALWFKLRNRQVDGWKFKRQFPFGRFILDFFCFDARLAIEVDGGSHASKCEIASDEVRTDFLDANGVRVLRVSNEEVRDNISGVLELIYAALGQQPAPSPGAARRPLPKGRGIPNAEAS